MKMRLDVLNDEDAVDCGIDFDLSDGDVAMPIDEMWSRIFKPAFIQLFSLIERKSLKDSA